MTEYSWANPPTLLAPNDVVHFYGSTNHVGDTFLWGDGSNIKCFEDLRLDVTKTAARFGVTGNGQWPEGPLDKQTKLVCFLLEEDRRQSLARISADNGPKHTARWLKLVDKRRAPRLAREAYRAHALHVLGLGHAIRHNPTFEPLK